MTPEQSEQIHAASIALLHDPGVRIEHDAICEKLVATGAEPGAAAQVIRFPAELVDEALQRAPSAVTFADRRGGARTIGPASEPCIWSVPGMNICRRGEHRLFNSTDMADWARLLDRLPSVDGVFGLALDDISPTARDVVGLRIVAEHTSKHIRVLSFSPEGADCIGEMKDIVGDTPWFSVGFTAHGPLRWTNLALEIYARTANRGIPATINGEPMAGTSGPVTLAGTAAVGNAEILAGLVVNQVLEPGRPCVYNLGLAHVFDMCTAIAVTGGPENHLLADVSAAMGRFYDLPSCSWVSTESMLPDEQAAFEKSIGYQSHLASGVSLIWGVGQLESELTVSPAQAVIDNEILSYLDRLRRGVEVDPQALALDVIRDVGIAGSFLEHEHTHEHYREELFQPSLLCRLRRSKWQERGAKCLSEAAEDRADDLIGGDSQPCLPQAQSDALRRVEERFLQNL